MTQPPDTDPPEAATSRRFFLALMGAPYRDETVTTLFRLADAALAAGHAVDVWCCGAATHLTAESLGAAKPRDMTRLSEDVPAPTTARLVEALGERHGAALRWHVCRHCAEEHGAAAPVAPARIRPSPHFAKMMAQADVSLVMGVK